MNISEERKRAAITRSVEHWERMIEWAKTQRPYGDVRYSRMDDEIGEGWFSVDCSLCIMYYIPKEKIMNPPAVSTCGACPVTPDCFDKESLWVKVNSTRNWKEWIPAAEDMLNYLKSLQE